jgi:hypothetical protein
MSVQDRPLWVPILLLGAALAAAVLPGRGRRGRLPVAVVGALLALGVIADLVPVTGSGPLSPSLGDAVPGVPITLRDDQLGLALAAMAVVAALFALGAPDRRPGMEPGVLVTAGGSVIAATAGNVVVLFAGLEIANLGGLLLARAGSGRLSRGALARFTVEHAFGLALLIAAVLLIVATGTSDPYSLPSSAVGLAAAIPWGLAGAARLLAPAWWPSSEPAGATRIWLSAGAIPCGAAVLLRLNAGLDSAPPPALTAVLAGIGVAATLAGGVAAWRRRAEPARAGRALAAGLAGPVVALAAVPGGTGAVAAGVIALEIALLAAPAWSGGPRPDRASRALAALVLISAAGLPIGFGTTAMVVELGATAAQGAVYTPLLLGLGSALLVVMAAGLGAARYALAGRPATPAPAGPRLDAAIALVIGTLAALLPGETARLALAPLAGSGAPTPVDAASLAGPGGAWPGGYLSLALIAVLLGGTSAAALLGRTVPHPFRPEGAPGRGRARLRAAGAWRAAAPALRRVGAAIGAVDAWLVTQPGLLFVVAAAIAAIYLFR